MTYITPEQYAEAEENGVSAHQLYHRVYNGWSLRRAINTPVQVKKPFESRYMYLAISNGISVDTFRRRVRYSGWDEYEAATTPPIPLGKRSKFKTGSKAIKFSPGQLEILRRNKVTPELARQRINRFRWDMDMALTKKTMGAE